MLPLTTTLYKRSAAASADVNALAELTTVVVKLVPWRTLKCNLLFSK